VTSAGEPQAIPGVGRMASNAVVQAVSVPLQSLISLGTFAAITRYLGPGAFGDYTAVMAFLFIPTVIADIGLSAIVLRDISAAPERMREIVNASLSLRALISLGAVVVTAAVAFVLPLDHRARIGVLIGSPGAFLTLMNLSLLPVLQAELRMHRSVVANLVGRTVTLGLTLGALALGLGFDTIVAVGVAGLAVILVINAAAVHSMLRLRPTIDLVYWRSFLRASLVLGVGLAVSQVYFRIDTVLLALLRSPAEVGLYGAAYKFVELSQALLFGAVITIVPAMTALAARGDRRFETLTRHGLEVLIAAAFPVTLAMLLAPKALLNWTAGSQYGAAATSLKILSLYPIIAVANTLLWRMLIAVHLERLLLISAVSILALNVALNLALIPPYGYTAAASTSVASEVVSLALSVWFVRKRFALTYSWRAATTVLVAAGATCAIALLLPGPRPLTTAAGLVVYAAILCAAPGTIRQTVLGLVRRPSARPA
jgi:O-antigen/teichoic acid export membrane protein